MRQSAMGEVMDALRAVYTAKNKIRLLRQRGYEVPDSALICLNEVAGNIRDLHLTMIEEVYGEGVGDG